jgi:hypothetical protein
LGIVGEMNVVLGIVLEGGSDVTAWKVRGKAASCHGNILALHFRDSLPALRAALSFIWRSSAALREIGNRREREVFREKFRGNAIVLARGNENREILFIREQNHTEIGPPKQSRFRLDDRQFWTNTDVTVVRNVRYVSVCTAGFPIKKYPWCVNGRSNGDVAWKKQDVFEEVQC